MFEDKPDSSSESYLEALAIMEPVQTDAGRTQFEPLLIYGLLHLY